MNACEPIPQELKGRSGIYQITNTVNGKMYVGSAVNIFHRWETHLSDFKLKKHTSKFQNAWNKYGAQAFEFSVIEFVEVKDSLLDREQYWLDLLDTAKKGYNTNIKAESRLGTKMPKEVNEHLSKVRQEKEAKRKAAGIPHFNKGRQLDPAVTARQLATKRAKLEADKALGIPHFNKGRTGHKQSPETIAKRNLSREATLVKKAQDGIPHPLCGRKLSAEEIARREATRKANRIKKLEDNPKPIKEVKLYEGKPHGLRGVKKSPEAVAKSKITRAANRLAKQLAANNQALGDTSTGMVT